MNVQNVRFSNGRDLNLTTMDHPNTELVWYSSPHCIQIMGVLRVTFRMRCRVCADHDVLVEGALEVAGKAIENAVLINFECSDFISENE